MGIGQEEDMYYIPMSLQSPIVHSKWLATFPIMHKPAHG